MTKLKLEVKEKNDQIVQLKQALSEITSGAGHRLLLKYRCLKEKLLPLSSWRRAFYDRCLRRLKNGARTANIINPNNTDYFKIGSVESRKWPYNALPGYLYYTNDKDFDLLQAWFDETDAKQYIGDTDPTALSFISGLIMGGPSIKRIVQLGTYAGLTALVIGMLLRERKHEGVLASVDIDEELLSFSRKYVHKANLQNRVKLFSGNSASRIVANDVRNFLGGPPQLIFIDSSHTYGHTLKELDIWYPILDDSGIILLHDSTEYAESFDPTMEGGVHKALKQWCRANMVNFSIFSPPTYENPCGLGLITKTRL